MNDDQILAGLCGRAHELRHGDPDAYRAAIDAIVAHHDRRWLNALERYERRIAHLDRIWAEVVPALNPVTDEQLAELISA